MRNGDSGGRKRGRIVMMRQIRHSVEGEEEKDDESCERTIPQTKVSPEGWRCGGGTFAPLEHRRRFSTDYAIGYSITLLKGEFGPDSSCQKKSPKRKKPPKNRRFLHAENDFIN
jgi:hypothetical protein